MRKYLWVTPSLSVYSYSGTADSLILLERLAENPSNIPNMDSRWVSMSLRRFRRSAFTFEKVSSWGMTLPSSNFSVFSMPTIPVLVLWVPLSSKVCLYR